MESEGLEGWDGMGACGGEVWEVHCNMRLVITKRKAPRIKD